MSTAAKVPETFDLDSDDARETLQHTGRAQLLKDAYLRLRVADGFSHARSLAFVTSLVLIQGVIAVVGLASALGNGSVGQSVGKALRDAAPGPAGDLLTQASNQATNAGSTGQWIALGFGLVGALIAGTTAMGQMERGLNRIYGVEKDRPTLQKYGMAFGLVLTAGVLITAAFASLALGRAIAASFGDSVWLTVWNLARWPVGIAAVVGGVALLFKWAPRRRQPAWSWLAYGAAVSVAGWTAVTLGLALFFRLSGTFGDTYGPLAGIVGLLLWGLLSAVAVLYGGAVAAQLEAVRAGVPNPCGPELNAAGNEAGALLRTGSVFARERADDARPQRNRADGARPGVPAQIDKREQGPVDRDSVAAIRREGDR